MNKFVITSVRIRKLEENTSKIVGIASIVINESFLINDIRIIKKDDKMFCGMPSRYLGNHVFKDICNPLNNETRTLIENRILAEYINLQDEKNEV